MTNGFSFTVEIFMPTMLYTGSYTLPLYRRVSDALNNRLSRFIHLHQVSIAPLWRPQQAQRVPQALVAWGDALLVAVVAEPEPPPDHRTAVIPRAMEPVMFFTGEFAVRAEIYRRPDIGLDEMLNELTDDFIPLRNATIFPIHGGTPLQRSFACLAQRTIQALYAIRQPSSSEPVEEIAAPSDHTVASEDTSTAQSGS
ncbi:MAG: hypothetical protein C0184_02630 [Chloroflexus aggregans]|uniref:Uncharacterized protein n=1 Tax=Chloroflexus aggregans TaxID=152260 RepID=A0A2J6XBX1_9CHLR|nr:MAG: hypothetical protein C0184_02630 [Chloroflexus aggregans]